MRNHSLFLSRTALYRWLLLASLFISALGVRLFLINDISSTPLRQTRSFMIARSLYYQNNPSIPQWERTVSEAQIERDGQLEPRIMEHLAAWSYYVAGGEHIWIPRLFSSLWWLIGGFFLFLLIKKIISLDSAVMATSFFLFLPFGAIASRNFQPDSLMVMFFLISLFTIVRFFEEQTYFRIIVAALFSSLAILVKVPILFPIAGAFISLSLWRDGLKQSLVNPKLYLYALICLVFGTGYYINNIYSGQAVGSFLGVMKLAYLLKPTFWGGWLAQIHLVIGFISLVGGLVGFFFLHKGVSKALLVGLWISYLFFGLFIAPYHIATHDYYQLFFIPIIAISLAPVFDFLMNQLSKWNIRKAARLGLFLFCVLLSAASAGINIFIVNYDRHGRWQRNEREIAKEIGKLVQHSSKTVFLGISQGYPLRYHGKISGKALNITNAALEKYFQKKDLPDVDLFANKDFLGFVPEYFVVTELLEFKRKPHLMNFLNENYPLLTHKPDYMIFDLRQKLIH